MRRFIFSISFRLSAFHFVALETSCANVIFRNFSVLDERNLLNIHAERSLRFTVTVAYIVAGNLCFSANGTNS